MKKTVSGFGLFSVCISSFEFWIFRRWIIALFVAHFFHLLLLRADGRHGFGGLSTQRKQKRIRDGDRSVNGKNNDLVNAACARALLLIKLIERSTNEKSIDSLNHFVSMHSIQICVKLSMESVSISTRDSSPCPIHSIGRSQPATHLTNQPFMNAFQQCSHLSPAHTHKRRERERVESRLKRKNYSSIVN